MAHLIKRSDFPVVSADPEQQIIEHGLPLYRFQQTTRFVKYYQEKELIPRTNDFLPSIFARKDTLKPIAHTILSNAPEFKDLAKNELTDILARDLTDRMTFEQLDPLKGNGFLIADILDGFELYLFGAGPSLSTLVIALSPNNKSYETTAGQRVKLALDEIQVENAIDLLYPIRQIAKSPLNKHIFAVRTTCTIHIFEYKTPTSLLDQIHVFNFPKQNQTHPSLRYSMPVHVELSPFHPYQYLFTTTNGFTALIDVTKDSFVFEKLDSIPEDIDYISQWRSCSFGNTPFLFYIASPECIKEWYIMGNIQEERILAISNDRIIAFNTFGHNSYLYCFVTLESIIIMDSILPAKPVFTWLHQMTDGPPTQIIINQIELPDIWQITAFSNITQRASLLKFKYVNRPTESIVKSIQVLEVNNFIMSTNQWEHVYQYASKTTAMGFQVKINDVENPITQDGAFFSLYRLFEDGSVRLQYVALSKQKPIDLQNAKMASQPHYQFTPPNNSLALLIEQAAIGLLPNISTRYPELVNVDVTEFKSYLNEQLVVTGSEKLSDKQKFEIACQVRNLKTPTTFENLLNGQELQNYSLQELVDFLKDLETYENIELVPQISLPKPFCYYHHNNNDNLMPSHDKKTALSNLILRPLPLESDGFQYMHQPNEKYTSTTTTRVLANFWPVNPTTRHETLLFPQHDYTKPLEKESFPSISKKRQRLMSNINTDTSNALPITVTTFGEEEEPLFPPEFSMPTVVTSSWPKKSITATTSNHYNSISSKKSSFSMSQDTSAPTLSQQRQISSQALPQSTSTGGGDFLAISTQPLPGAYGSRTTVKKSAPKKKKPKTSGFR